MRLRSSLVWAVIVGWYISVLTRVKRYELALFGLSRCTIACGTSGAPIDWEVFWPKINRHMPGRLLSGLVWAIEVRRYVSMDKQVK